MGWEDACALDRRGEHREHEILDYRYRARGCRLKKAKVTDYEFMMMIMILTVKIKSKIDEKIIMRAPETKLDRGRLTTGLKS